MPEKNDNFHHYYAPGCLQNSKLEGIITKEFKYLNDFKRD